MADYHAILTSVGQAKLANALALGATITVTRMAVGDGGGADITPTESMTALVGEVYRGAVETLTVDADNPAWVVADLVIPVDEGGWWVREVGLFDDAGDMLAIANLPAAYKPVLAEGSTRDMIVRMVLEVSDTRALTLTIDPTVTLASRAWVLQHLPGAATTEARGLVELATKAETIAGTDAERAVTPAGLGARTATTTRAGLIALATIDEAIAGTDAERTVTPAGLAATIAATVPGLLATGAVRAGVLLSAQGQAVTTIPKNIFTRVDCMAAVGGSAEDVAAWDGATYTVPRTGLYLIAERLNILGDDSGEFHQIVLDDETIMNTVYQSAGFGTVTGTAWVQAMDKGSRLEFYVQHASAAAREMNNNTMAQILFLGAFL